MPGGVAMLTEIEKTRQIPGEGIRRWFRDDELDLIVWYGDDGSIEGFQLCYDKLQHERALTSNGLAVECGQQIVRVVCDSLALVCACDAQFVCRNLQAGNH